MPLDWNWFFSSLSQSAAAIVGIFGAFIITKIFSNQTIYVEKKARLKQLLTQAQKISDTANSFNIDWYNEQCNKPGFYRFENYLDNKLPKEESIDVITEEFLNEYISTNAFSKYTEPNEIKEELKSIASNVFKENIRVREEEEATERARKSIEEGELGGMAKFMHNMTRMDLGGVGRSVVGSYSSLIAPPWDIVRAISQGFDKSYLDAKHHAREVSVFLEGIKGNPESPRQISFALILVLFIFFIGVIYPLSFMPAGGAPKLDYSAQIIINQILSFKGFLLGVISIAFTVIVTIFFTTNIRMVYSQADVLRVEQLTDAKSYCHYFKCIDRSDAK